MIFYILAIHVCGVAGAFAARKLRLPAGALIGSMIAVAALHIMIPWAAAHSYPLALRAVVQALSGTVLALSFARDDLALLRKIPATAALVVGLLLAFNIGFAMIITRVSWLSPVTALFATAPGGISDIALIAGDFDADTHTIALLQIFRFVFVVSFFPFVIRRYITKGKTSVEFSPAAPLAVKFSALSARQKRRRLVLTLAAAFAGAALGRSLGIPAGGLLGSLVFVAVLGAGARLAYVAPVTRQAVQICAGTYIGSLITADVALSIQFLALPAAILAVQILVMTFVSAWIASRLTKLNFATALFSCVPGGISEMSLIAADMGLHVPTIVLLHTCRIIAVVGAMPIFIAAFV